MNILMIMTDQQHKYALGKVTDYVKTPNLDRLAEQGTIFTNAYSNNPVCTPFRGILYSGRYSKDNKCFSNEYCLQEDEITLPEELEKIGYETSFVGKLHLGGSGNKPIPIELRAGHKYFMGFQCYNGFLDDVCLYDENGVEHKSDKHRTDYITDVGIERMRMLAQTDKPFLHTIFFQAPHYPEEPSLKYEKLYDEFEFPLPEEYSEIEPYTQTYSPQSPTPFENCRNYQRYGNNIQLYLKLYYAMVSQIDYNVGRIIDELDKLGIAEDTAIIFSSDHGDMQGSHGLKNKNLPFERSCGIPLIVKIPKLNQIPVCDKPVSAVDYYQTCMEIANTKTVKNLPGKSLIPLVKGETTDHPPVYAENNPASDGWIMIRENNMKLVLNKKTYADMYLFDLEKDPTESQNLISDITYQTIKNSLKEKLTT